MKTKNNFHGVYGNSVSNMKTNKRYSKQLKKTTKN